MGGKTLRGSVRMSIPVTAVVVQVGEKCGANGAVSCSKASSAKGRCWGSSSVAPERHEERSICYLLALLPPPLLSPLYAIDSG